MEAMGAANAEEWAEAWQYEMDVLSKNDTWELVDLPLGCKAVKSKWVFKLKADGRFHACLVAKGFMQIPGIDYDETFSPVAHFELLRLLLALAALENWKIHQMDVKSALGSFKVATYFFAYSLYCQISNKWVLSKHNRWQINVIYHTHLLLTWQ